MLTAIKHSQMQQGSNIQYFIQDIHCPAMFAEVRKVGGTAEPEMKLSFLWLSQRKSSACFILLHSVTFSHYHHCITNHLPLTWGGSSCSDFTLYSRGAVGTSVGRREASYSEDCFPGWSSTTATSAHELVPAGTRTWECLWNNFCCIYSAAGTFASSFL